MIFRRPLAHPLAAGFSSRVSNSLSVVIVKMLMVEEDVPVMAYWVMCLPANLEKHVVVWVRIDTLRFMMKAIRLMERLMV